METVIGISVSTLFLVGMWAFMHLRRASDAPLRPFDDSEIRRRLDAQQVALKVLEQDMTETRAAVAEGIQHVERVENRIRSTVRRAQEKLSEHGYESPGLEAEAAQLQLLDGGRSEEKELPPMRQSLGSTPSPFPGLTMEDLARMRGAG